MKVGIIKKIIWLFKKPKNIGEYKCEYCGKKFYCKKSDKMLFCSKICKEFYDYYKPGKCDCGCGKY